MTNDLNTIAAGDMQEDTTRVCSVCGETITEDNIAGDYQDANGVICNNCVDNGDYVYCDDIEAYEHIDNVTFVNTDGYMHGDGFYCVSVDNYNNIEYDETQGEYFDNSNGDCGYWVHTYDGEQFICYLTYDRGSYGTCDNCGEIFDSDLINYCEDNDAYYCEDCYDEYETRDNVIHDYGFNPSWQLFKSDKDADDCFYLGVELETERTNGGDYVNATELAENIQGNYYFKHDGSLCNGVEIISHPQTLNYIKDHIDVIRHNLSWLSSAGYTSHDNGDCGLHVHVSKPSDEVINRIDLLIETYKNELTIFSRRKPEQLQHWASFISDRGTLDDVERSSSKVLKDYRETHSNRYCALNTCTNKPTIEFRIFRGTLNFTTYMATLELVNNIVKKCSDLTIPLNKITWASITNTKYCKEYCKQLSIKTTKKIADTSAKIDAIIDEFMSNKDSVTKLIDNSVADLMSDYRAEIYKDSSANDMQGLETIIKKTREMQDVLDRLLYIKTYYNNDNINYSIVKNFNRGLSLVIDYLKGHNFINPKQLDIIQSGLENLTKGGAL